MRSFWLRCDLYFQKVLLQRVKESYNSYKVIFSEIYLSVYVLSTSFCTACIFYECGIKVQKISHSTESTWGTIEVSRDRAVRESDPASFTIRITCRHVRLSDYSVDHRPSLDTGCKSLQAAREILYMRYLLRSSGSDCDSHSRLLWIRDYTGIAKGYDLTFNFITL